MKKISIVISPNMKVDLEFKVSIIAEIERIENEAEYRRMSTAN